MARCTGYGCDESLRAIRLADGREQYHIVAGANTAASPVIGGGRVYVGTFNNEVLAIDLRGRKIAWRYENPDRQFPFYSSAALANGRVIVGSRDKLLHAIDAVTGKLAWSFTTRARVDSSPAVADGRVYVGTTRYRGRVAFRPAIVNWRTTEADVDLIVEVVRELGARLGVTVA